jgi:hypothetical protein
VNLDLWVQEERTVHQEIQVYQVKKDPEAKMERRFDYNIYSFFLHVRKYKKLKVCTDLHSVNSFLKVFDL